jgi:hypothetical protein
MSFQAYIDNIKAKTGKAHDDFKKLAIASSNLITKLLKQLESIQLHDYAPLE